ncbi:MAG: hypothetical protein AAGG09_03610 [Pseudomonadota bacterium]
MTVDVQSLVFLGWFAVVGGLLNVVADWFLLGLPVAGRDLRMEMLAQKPAWAVRLGAYLAMVAIPMWIAVTVPAAFLLRDAPTVLILVPLIGIALISIYALVYHVSYIFYDAAYRHAPDVADLLLQEKAFQTRLMMLVGLVTYGALLAGGLWSGAPWWWLAASPIVLQPAFSFAARLAPAPVGGYLLTGAGSLGFTAFALVTMLAVTR